GHLVTPNGITVTGILSIQGEGGVSILGLDLGTGELAQQTPGVGSSSLKATSHTIFYCNGFDRGRLVNGKGASVLGALLGGCGAVQGVVDGGIRGITGDGHLCLLINRAFVGGDD